MTRQYKVSLFAFLFSLLFFLPQVAHGRLAVHHIHRRLPPHNQHIHRQNDPVLLSGLGSGLGSIVSSIAQSPDPGGTSSPPSTSTSSDGSSATTAPATTAPPGTTTPSSSDSPNAASPFSVLSPSSPSSSPPSQTSDPPSSSPPASSSSSPPAQTSDPPSSSPSASSSSSPPPQTSDPPSSSPPSTSNPPSSSSASDNTPTPLPANSTPQSSQPPSSPSTSSPPTATCPLGVDLFGRCIVSSASTDVPPTSTPSSQPQTPASLTSSSGTPAPPLSSNNPISLPPVSSNAPTSSAPPSSNTPASSPLSSDTPAPPLSSNIPVSLSPSLSDAPTSSTPPPSLNTPVSSPLPSLSNAPVSLSLSSSLPALSSNAPNSSPLPSASSPLASSTNLPSSSATTPIAPTSSPSPDNQSSSPSPAHSSSAPIDPCGPSGCTTSGAPTRSSDSVLRQSLTSFPTSQLASSSPGSDSHSQSPPVSTPGFSNSGALSSSGPLSSTPIASQSGASSIPGSLSQSASGTATEPSTTFSGTNPASLSASSSGPVISFPSYTTGPSDQTTSVPTSTGSSAPAFTQNSQFSFITVTSLLGTSVQSSSIPPTLTNPDAPVTTLTLPDASTSAAGPVASAPLPTDLPSRIYPADVVNPSSLPSGDVLCSLLFTSFLPWNFVATHTQSQGQLFSWTPIIISQALNISSTDTPPFALQVFVPDSYQGPDDADMLRTEYLFYLPNNLVSVLANEIKVQSSPFYNIAEPYKDLAVQVDPAFALTSVPNPNAVPGTTSAASGGNKSRTATIIGVVSALGGLALIILGTLVFNGVKRSRQLRHQRLSDPNLPNDPYPDRSGRDFDQDSVGGPRRRSFYFAEDSLRGQPQTAEESTAPMPQAQAQFVAQPGSQIQYSSRSSPENMRERRAPVLTGAISAPILTQSSLNW